MRPPQGLATRADRWYRRFEPPDPSHRGRLPTRARPPAPSAERRVSRSPPIPSEPPPRQGQRRGAPALAAPPPARRHPAPMYRRHGTDQQAARGPGAPCHVARRSPLATTRDGRSTFTRLHVIRGCGGGHIPESPGAHDVPGRRSPARHVPDRGGPAVSRLSDAGSHGRTHGRPDADFPPSLRETSRHGSSHRSPADPVGPVANCLCDRRRSQRQRPPCRSPGQSVSGKRSSFTAPAARVSAAADNLPSLRSPPPIHRSR